MEITYLVGNGFDLNIGLKTGYKDFLKLYRQPSESDSEAIRFLKNNIETDSNLWKDAELAFGSVTDAFRLNGFKQEDFEACYRNFTNSLVTYLKGQQIEIDTVDFGSHAKWKASLANDLKKITTGLTEENRIAVNGAISRISGGYEFSFINFNYTNTLERFIETVNDGNSLGIRELANSRFSNSIKTIQHVHGTLESDLVFAVNDTSQISCIDTIQTDPIFMQLFTKESANALYEEKIEEKCIKILESSDIICIYGMSIGETDKRWWGRIGRLLSSNENLCLIIFDHGLPEKSTDNLPFLRYRINFLNRFVDMFDADIDNKDDIRNRIFLSNGNPFRSIKGIVANAE